MHGKIVNLYVKPSHKQSLTEVSTVQAESNMGLIGDVSYGRSKRQVLLIEKETLDEFGLVPGQIKENITVVGMRVAGLSEGTLLKAGEALLEVTGDCQPCQLIEDIRPGLQNEMTGRRGTLCRVIEGGSVQVGDSMLLADG
jgi:MOSC domain-containing protein YiiM